MPTFWTLRMYVYDLNFTLEYLFYIEKIICFCVFLTNSQDVFSRETL